MSRDENKDENVATKLQYNTLKEAIFLREKAVTRKRRYPKLCLRVFFIQESEKSKQHRDKRHNKHDAGEVIARIRYFFRGLNRKKAHYLCVNLLQFQSHLKHRLCTNLHISSCENTHYIHAIHHTRLKGKIFITCLVNMANETIFSNKFFLCSLYVLVN